MAVLTLVDLVAGEMVPKSLALQHADRFARIVYWPMRVVVVLTFPLLVGIGAIGRAVLALAGITRQSNAAEHLHTPDELRLIVEESERGGALRAEAGHLLKELFEFGDLTAGQVMVPRVRVVGLPAGATPDVIRSTLATADHTRYPVFDGDLDHIVGMVHVKDLLRKLIQQDGLRATDVRPLPVVPGTKPLDDVLTTMQRAHAHMAIVIDEHGGTGRVVSIEDLVEEVVGDIEDARPGTEPIVMEPNGSVRAAGTVRLAELGAVFAVIRARRGRERERPRAREARSSARRRRCCRVRTAATGSALDGRTGRAGSPRDAPAGSGRPAAGLAAFFGPVSHVAGAPLARLARTRVETPRAARHSRLATYNTEPNNAASSREARVREVCPCRVLEPIDVPSGGNSRIQIRTTASVPRPPATTAGTVPSHAAVMPDSNSPSSFEAPMNSMLTALTRPRIGSGVAY